MVYRYQEYIPIQIISINFTSSQEDLEVKQTLKVLSSSSPSFLGQCSLD
jgi:hypothetical protein